MSPITIGVISIAGSIMLIAGILKNFYLKSLIRTSETGDLDAINAMLSMPLIKVVLSDYVCDLYKLKVLYRTRRMIEFEEFLNYMLKADYKEENKKSFLELYFHTFVVKNEQKYAKIVFDTIKETNDVILERYCNWSYEVFFNNRTDFIDEMDKIMDTKDYYGFTLGAIIFAMARQYELLGDKQNAYLYYYNSKLVFHTSAVYYPLIEPKLQELEPDVDLSKLKNEK